MATSDEFKAAKKVADLISKGGFEVKHFAACMTNEGIFANQQMFHIFMALVTMWAGWLNDGMVGPKDPMYNTCIWAQRILEMTPDYSGPGR